MELVRNRPVVAVAAAEVAVVEEEELPWFRLPPWDALRTRFVRE